MISGQNWKYHLDQMQTVTVMAVQDINPNNTDIKWMKKNWYSLYMGVSEAQSVQITIKCLSCKYSTSSKLIM